MRYLGGKWKSRKSIAKTIAYYLTPGGTAVPCQERIGSDKNKYLIALLKECQKNGAERLPVVDEAFYRKVKENKADYPEWLVGAIGFLFSFGGVFFSNHRGIKPMFG